MGLSVATPVCVLRIEAHMLRVAPSRRSFLIGAGALVASTAIGPAFGAKVSTFVDNTWAAAKSRGVSRKIFDAAMGGFKPLKSVI